MSRSEPAPGLPAQCGAVFLSYASQDAEAVRRMAEALRSAGVEVWFDQNELVGGDAWDRKIRGQIASCALFVPVISAATQARTEGYFRLEWRLADQRTHLMAKGRPFLLPVVIDATRDAEAHVPDSFTEVQWTRLPGGETPEKFCARVRALLGGDGAPVRSDVGASLVGARVAHDGDGRGRAAPLQKSRRFWLVPAILAIAAVVVLARWQPWRGKEKPAALSALASVATTAPLSEARQLVAKAWVLMNKTEVGRAELEAADELCKRAAALDSTDADVQAAWSQVDTWFVYHNFDATPERRERARIKAARALQLAPAAYEARLAQACYHVRGAGDQIVPMDVGATEDLLKGLLREKPDEPRALFALGILQSNVEHLAEARATFGRLAENPAFAATAWSEVGWAELLQAVDYRAAEVAADRSIALQPFWGNLSLKSYLATLWRGDLDGAIAAHLRIPAVEREEDLGVSHACELYFLRREPAKGLRLLDTVSRDWLRSNGYEGPKAIWAALAEEQLGRKDRAEVQWQAALKLIERRLADQSDSDLLLGLKAYVLAALGRSADAENTMRLLREGYSGAAKGRRSRDVIIYARLGQADKALDLLEKDPSLTAASARIDPRFDPLRALPRFQALQARLDADPRFSPAAKEPTPTDAAATKPAEKSIAVLAFKNLSGDKEQEYFSDGLSEELSNVLGRVTGLRVAGSTSAFSFKVNPPPLREIARQLGVAHLVEGTVRKEGNTIHITAKLINAADGFSVWTSENFKREVKSSLAVQEEIAGLIAKALSLKLGVASPASTAEVNPQAFELYLQGRQAWNLRTAAGFERAEQLFNRALAVAPTFARAHAALADVWNLRGQNAETIGRFEQRNSTVLARTIAKAREALALDPDSAEAHSALGGALYQQWKFPEAEREMRRAIELNPNYATAHQILGRLLGSLGFMDEALAALKRAAELDPLSARIVSNYALMLVLADRLSDAIIAADHSLAVRPEEFQAMVAKAHALVRLGRAEEAAALSRGIPPQAEFTREMQVAVLARAGLRQEAEMLFSNLNPNARRHNRIRALLVLGRRQEASALLESGPMMVNGMSSFFFESEFDVIRGEPRFIQMLTELGVGEAHAGAQAWRAANVNRR